MEELRVRWGCDAPADRIVFRMTCNLCSGENAECEECGGSGYRDMRRCPAASTDASAQALLSSYTWLDRFQVLPAPGGMLDQHPRFIEAVRLIEHERANIDRDRADAQRRKAEMANRTPSPKGRKGR